MNRKGYAGIVTALVSVGVPANAQIVAVRFVPDRYLPYVEVRWFLPETPNVRDNAVLFQEPER